MIRAYFEGTCEPNKDGGLMVYETIIYKDYQKVHECCEVYDKWIASNHIAEYCGLIAVLKYLISTHIQDETIYLVSDSQLITGQMSKNWAVKKGKYKPYAQHAIKLIKELDKFNNESSFYWMPVRKRLLSLPNILGNPNYEGFCATT